MKAMNLIATGLMVLTLSACGVVKDVKNANNMEKEGNALAAQINAESTALNKDEDINVDSTVNAMFVAWDKKTPEKRAALRARLVALDLKIIRYIEIAGHKDFASKNIGAKIIAEMRQDSLRTHINYLDKSEGKPQSFPKQKVS